MDISIIRHRISGVFISTLRNAACTCRLFKGFEIAFTKTLTKSFKYMFPTISLKSLTYYFLTTNRRYFSLQMESNKMAKPCRFFMMDQIHS